MKKVTNKKIQNNIEHVWSIICHQSTTDSESNNVSLINLIENVTFTVPTNVIEEVRTSKAKGIIFPLDYEIISRFRRNDDVDIKHFYSRLRMMNPEGNEVTATGENEMIFSQGVKNVRMRAKFNDIAVQNSGVYRVLIETRLSTEAKFETVGSIPLEINLITISG
jgi:hypothetical protein